MASGYVLYHRLADADSAGVRRWIVEQGRKQEVDFQNVDSDGREAFAALGGREVPALWDGERLVIGADAIRAVLAGAR